MQSNMGYALGEYDNLQFALYFRISIDLAETVCQ